MVEPKRGKSITKEVIVSPKAFVVMALHATRHRFDSVHGLLLGKADTKTCVTTVEDVVPVSHGAPTMPLVEAAIALTQAHQQNDEENSENKIVGWYTAPMLLDDTQAGPVALRIAASLAVEGNGDDHELDPTLLVLHNVSTFECFKSNHKPSTDSKFQAYGRDFANQWLNPIHSSMSQCNEDTEISEACLQKAIQKSIVVNDLMDHFNGPAILSWYPYEEIGGFLGCVAQMITPGDGNIRSFLDTLHCLKT